MNYIKHRINCKCILPQLKYKIPTIFHSFIVFSVIDSNQEFQISFEKCNNCGVIHKILEVEKSKILNGKEDMSTILSIDEIKKSIPEQISNVLQSYDCPKHTWEEVKFILENSLWGKSVILKKEFVDDTTCGKYMIIFGESLIKIENFTREEYVK